MSAKRVIIMLFLATAIPAMAASPGYRVVVGESVAEPVRFAADELARYIGQAPGATAQVSGDAAWDGLHAVCLVGAGVPTPPEAPASTNEEAYRIVSIDGGRAFRGNSPRAVVYAVYDFLEEEIGCRWYFPYPEDAIGPRVDAEALARILGTQVDREECPAFPFREREFRDVMPMADGTDARIVQQIDWWAKLRMNRFLLNFGYARNAELWERWKTKLIPEIKRRGLLVGLGEHGSYPLFLPPSRYAQDHPEWYCEIDGKRVGGMRAPNGAGCQFCTTNPEAVAAYLENFAAFVRDNPEIDFYYPAPNDVGKWCECETCSQLSIADRYMRLDNQVAEMFERIKPGTRIMHLAYSNHRLPPEQTLPHPMIDVDVACWGRDFAYPLSDPRTMPGNDEYLDVFRQWAGVCLAVPGDVRPRMLYHCKLMRHYWLGLHLAPLAILDQDFVCAQDLGLDGFDFPLGFVGIWTKALNTYAVANKTWDPTTPASSLVERFFDGYYGDESERAGEVYRLVGEAATDRRYGSSLALSWHPERIGVRDQPLEGLADHARNAVAKLDEAMALVDDAQAEDPAVAARFVKLRRVLQRARDEQDVLVKLDALIQAHRALSETHADEDRQRAMDAWHETKAASDALAESYSLEEDLAGLYWAGATHNDIGRALEQWREAVEGLDWQRIDVWRTDDFETINVPIEKAIDISEYIDTPGIRCVDVKFKYQSGELGGAIRAVSLWTRGGDGELHLLAEDRHGGFAGYVHEKARYSLEVGTPLDPSARYIVKVDLLAQGGHGTVARRGCNGEILLGLPEMPETASLPQGVHYRVVELNEPQMLADDYLIDNRFNEDFISARVPHVLHRGERLAEPVLTKNDDMPWESGHGIGYVSVMYDAYADVFRLYYQIWNPKDDPEAYLSGYCSCLAVSEDGLQWQKPLFDSYAWGPRSETNIVVRGEHEGKIVHVHSDRQEGVRPDGERVRNIGMLSPEDLRGHRFLAYYCDHEHYLAVSEDAQHWELAQQTILPNRVDCFQTICHDPSLAEYVIFYRNKLIYDDRSPMGKGNTRMITRIASKELWSLWDTMPDTVLLPDGDDKGRFYSMPTFRYGGLYWGMLTQFWEEPQKIEVELVWSRDGFHWNRAPGRPMLIPVGEDGAWDDGMVFAADRVIERNEEWWLYYTGHDGYHDSRDRTGSVGLIKFRKEGFVSVSADSRGKESFIVTRPLLWPGGELIINADAGGGYVKAAITDVQRQPYEGFGYDDCLPFEGDSVRHTVSWKNAKMDALKGKLVRIEFAFKHADLYAFLAAKEPEQ